MVLPLGVFALIAFPSLMADAGEVDRTRLDLILAVLRTAPSEAGRACLGSMRGVHELEQRAPVQTTQLEFSYQNAAQLCGADAARVCRDKAAADNETVCRALGVFP